MLWKTLERGLMVTSDESRVVGRVQSCSAFDRVCIENTGEMLRVVEFLVEAKAAKNDDERTELLQLAMHLAGKISSRIFSN